jgi:predicted Rossmann fold nucleotide-binding protein DprA/Smf involved in DNA uptake
MIEPLSPNTQAILLLTAPLIVGRDRDGPEPLTPAQYRCLAKALHGQGATPADLLGSAAGCLCDRLTTACAPKFDTERLRVLLGRGFQLAQAIDHWRSHALWVVSRADPDYPRRLRERLREEAPAILYGCGPRALLDTGGLAVVGSRQVDTPLLEASAAIGELTARAGVTLVSGAARGIDQAAMGGALIAGGRAIGVLAADLKRAAVQRDHRDLLQDERLVLLSPYDPSAGFNVGNAMQRNKLIYALADAGLAMSADLEKGGTWAGASEQLRKYRLVPVYVYNGGTPSPGLSALREAGARPWPEPADPDALAALLAGDPVDTGPAESANARPAHPIASIPAAAPAADLAAMAPAVPTAATPAASDDRHAAIPSDQQSPIAGELFATVRRLILLNPQPRTESSIADELGVNKAQAKEWIARLVDEGGLEKLGRPARYRPRDAGYCQGDLFG